MPKFIWLRYLSISNDKNLKIEIIEYLIIIIIINIPSSLLNFGTLRTILKGFHLFNVEKITNLNRKNINFMKSLMLNWIISAIIK